MKKFFLLLTIAVGVAVGQQCTCTPSITTASGTAAPKNIRSGQLIFEDNFDSVDVSKWRILNTMSGGGTNEFQWYVNDTQNIFTNRGNLNIRPTLTADVFGESFLTSGRVVIPPSECTASFDNGCIKQGTPDNIINPIRSGGIDSKNTFAFKYGTVEIRAKMPSGDWLWPAIFMRPKESVYGAYPLSGGFYNVLSRGNRALFNGNTHVGNQQVQQRVTFGPSSRITNPFGSFYANQASGFDSDFKVYKLVWTPTQVQFFIDNVLVGTLNASTGLWNQAGFASSGLPNTWVRGALMAPFDQEFYIIINTSVGGTSGFADYYRNGNGQKPWLNTSPRPAADFWAGRNQWLPTWNFNSEETHFQVDYVRVWAL